MALKTTPWDSAEYLDSEVGIAAHLQACFEEAPDDPAFLVHAFGVAVRARNMSQLARDTGLTREGLYKALSENGSPSFGTVLKVADLTTTAVEALPCRPFPSRRHHHADTVEPRCTLSGPPGFPGATAAHARNAARLAAAAHRSVSVRDHRHAAA